MQRERQNKNLIAFLEISSVVWMNKYHPSIYFNYLFLHFLSLSIWMPPKAKSLFTGFTRARRWFDMQSAADTPTWGLMIYRTTHWDTPRDLPQNSQFVRLNQ